MKLDRIDRNILNLLQTDGGLTNTQLAKQVHLSPSACNRRVQRLQADGIIEGRVALIRQELVGKPTNVFVEVSLDSHSAESLHAFEATVRDCPEIMECYLISDESDYMLRVITTDTRDYEHIHRRYLSKFPGVARVHSSFAMRIVCKKTALVV